MPDCTNSSLKTLKTLKTRRIGSIALAPAALIVLACAILAVAGVSARAWLIRPVLTSKPASAAAQATPQKPNRLHSRLSLQPEADRLRRHLGKRFFAPGREVATLIGTLKLGTQQYTARITRSQEDDGESVTIGLNGGPATLTWNGKDGAKSDGSPATGNQRALIERLALDSPDQFILAQLRGASYQTVAQQARPAEAGGSDSYKGPVWDLVRIGEPPQPGRNLPQSQWRVYHINAATGLIDKVVSEEQGQTITAEITGWVNQGSETVPTRITWKQGSQTVMELSLTNIAHSPKQ